MKQIILSTSTTLTTTNDPAQFAEEYAKLQLLAKGRLDSMLGRDMTVPMYSWLSKDLRRSSPERTIH